MISVSVWEQDWAACKTSVEGVNFFAWQLAATLTTFGSMTAQTVAGSKCLTAAVWSRASVNDLGLDSGEVQCEQMGGHLATMEQLIHFIQTGKSVFFVLF